MTALGLIHKNAWRKPIRTLLLIVSIAIAFVIYSLLQSFLNGTPKADIRQDRLVVANRASSAQPLPYRYLSQLEAMDGVGQVAFTAKLRGFVTVEKNIAILVGVDATRTIDVFGDELGLTKALMTRFGSARDGILVGRMLASSMGWRVGDPVTITAFGQKTRSGSGTWSFTVEGIFEGRSSSTDTYFAMMHYDFFNTARARGVDTVDNFVVVPAAGVSASSLAPVIDARFANSDAPTQTQSEKQFLQSFMRQIADLNRVIAMVVSATLVTILMIVVNTMIFAVRERTFEIGVLKTIGFSGHQIMMLILSESLLVFLIGGGIGVGLGWGVCQMMDPSIGLVFTPNVMVTSAALIMGLGLLSGLLPAINAMRIPILQTFRAR